MSEMFRVTVLFVLLALFEIGNAGEIFKVKSFERANLEIEDNWSAKEVGYKDSDLISFFRKNLGVSEISEHPELNHLVYLTVTYHPDDVRGFPSKDDYALISDFEESDVPKIEMSSNSIHVASVMKNGIYDFLFYVSDPDKFLESINQNNSGLKTFKTDLELVKDSKWEIYHDFP